MVKKIFPAINISICIMIVLISYFLLANDDLSKMNQIIPFYNFYTKNKSAKLIKDIKEISPEEDCPKNSSTLLFYKYPGTKEGCLIKENNLEEGSCTLWTKLLNSYVNYDETNEKYFDVLYGKKLCAITFNDYDYISNMNDEKEKLCGHLDNIGNNFYVKEGEDCPINKIIIDNKEIIDNNYKTLELIKDEYYLHYSSDNLNSNNSLLTNESLFISEDLPCINPGEINTFHIQFLLSKANESYICNTVIDNKRLDERYKYISSINQKNLYKDNNIDLDKFVSYPFKEVNLHLYQLGYIGIDKQFIGDILNNSDKFKSDINSITDYNKYNRYITPLIFSSIFLVIINLIFKYFIMDITIYILNFILLVFDLGNLILNIFIFLLLNNFNSLEKYYSNNNNDTIFNSQIKYINDIINEIKEINKKNIIGICIMILLIIIFNLINFCIFNNPNNHLLKNKDNSVYYLKNKKIYNSINVLKPFEDKKEGNLKHKKEIELSKICDINDEENENNIINNTKDEEDNMLTND